MFNNNKMSDTLDLTSVPTEEPSVTEVVEDVAPEEVSAETSAEEVAPVEEDTGAAPKSLLHVNEENSPVTRALKRSARRGGSLHGQHVSLQRPHGVRRQTHGL